MSALQESSPIRYIALLRGINVGGHTVKMDRLRTLFVDMGFTNVGSYIQSGNIFFDTFEIDQAKIARAIEEHLRQALGFEVSTAIRTVQALSDALSHTPFDTIELTPDKRFCVVFATKPIQQDLVFPIRSEKSDLEIVGATHNELFIVWHIINGRPPASMKTVDMVTQGPSTSRFFHTAKKILTAVKIA